MQIKLPYGNTEILFEAPERAHVLYSNIDQLKSSESGQDIVRAAMAAPIDSPSLKELAVGKKTCTLIISDHTRPVPSRDILPAMLEALRQGNPEIDITLLVATGFHRPTTGKELEEKLGREIAHPVAQTHRVEHICGIQRIAADLGGQLHIFQRRQIGHQIVELEHKADVMAAVRGELLLGKGGNVFPLQQDLAVGERVHTTQNVQQRGLARAAGANDDAQFPPVHGEGGVLQGMDLHLTHLVGLFHMFKANKITHKYVPLVT